MSFDILSKLGGSARQSILSWKDKIDIAKSSAQALLVPDIFAITNSPPNLFLAIPKYKLYLNLQKFVAR